MNESKMQRIARILGEDRWLTFRVPCGYRADGTRFVWWRIRIGQIKKIVHLSDKTARVHYYDPDVPPQVVGVSMRGHMYQTVMISKAQAEYYLECLAKLR